MSPDTEGFEDSKEFFVMNIIIELRSGERAGMESDGVDFAIGSDNRQDGTQCIVRSVSLYNKLSVWDPVGKNRSVSECILQSIERTSAIFGKVPFGVFP